MPTTLPTPNMDDDTTRYIRYLDEKGRPALDLVLYTCSGESTSPPCLARRAIYCPWETHIMIAGITRS